MTMESSQGSVGSGLVESSATALEPWPCAHGPTSALRLDAQDDGCLREDIAPAAPVDNHAGAFNLHGSCGVLGMMRILHIVANRICTM